MIIFQHSVTKRENYQSFNKRQQRLRVSAWHTLAKLLNCTKKKKKFSLEHIAKKIDTQYSTSTQARNQTIGKLREKKKNIRRPRYKAVNVCSYCKLLSSLPWNPRFAIKKSQLDHERPLNLEETQTATCVLHLIYTQISKMLRKKKMKTSKLNKKKPYLWQPMMQRIVKRRRRQLILLLAAKLFGVQTKKETNLGEFAD